MLHHCNKTCLLNISVNLRYFSQFISSKKLTNVSLFYCKLILSVICTFFFISPCDIISISRLSLMLKIIDQCDFKQVIILLIKSLTYKKWYIIISLTHYNTSDNVCLDFHNCWYSICVYVYILLCYTCMWMLLYFCMVVFQHMIK